MGTTAQDMGLPEVDDGPLDGVASSVLGRAVHVEEWSADPVPYAWGSPSTAGLFRVRGTTTDGAAWRAFCKLLQHPRHWSRLDVVPPPMREDFLAHFPWRAELAAWEPAFAEQLPPGLRVPRLHALVDLGDDRFAVWMEDVREDPAPWDLARFTRAARALGGLAARRSDEGALAAAGVPAGFGLRRYVASRVDGTWSALLDDGLWSHPLLQPARAARLRADLHVLHDRLPAVLDHLDRLPQSVPHGDASPQNLLQPRDEPDVLVLIDLSFPSPCAVGFDLGQLLVGLVHADLLPARALPEVDAVLVDAYVAGARAEGLAVSPADVRDGYDGALLARAGFTSLPLDRLDEAMTGPLQQHARERAALTRFIADRGLALSRRI